MICAEVEQEERRKEERKGTERDGTGIIEIKCAGVSKH